MDFFIILLAFLFVVWVAAEMEAGLQKKHGSEKTGSCPPHPWRPRRTGDPAGNHYLICDICEKEPFVESRGDTPPK